MVRKVTKLFKKGYVDIKSFDREECIRKKESLTIIHDGQQMTLTPLQVKVKIKAKSSLMPDQVGKEDYYLYSYKWIPDGEE